MIIDWGQIYVSVDSRSSWDGWVWFPSIGDVLGPYCVSAAAAYTPGAAAAAGYAAGAKASAGYTPGSQANAGYTPGVKHGSGYTPGSQSAEGGCE